MSVDNFKPQLWSDRIQANLDKRLISSLAVNRNYEVDARHGVAKINQAGDIAVSSHAKNGTVAYGVPASAQKTLTLNQRKVAAFKVDDVDAVSANIQLVETYAQRMGYALADDIDRYIFSLHTERGLPDIAIDIIAVAASEVRNAFADIVANLNLNSVSGQPWVIISPRAYAGLMKDTAVTQATERSEEVLSSGALGRYMGVNIFTSNNLSGTGVTVQTNGAVAVGDTAVTVDALSAAVPAGTLLTFGGGMYLRTTADAASSATELTVLAATVAIPDNTAATYVKASKCLYGTSDAITFAMNLMPSVERLRDKDTTDDYVRAQQNYGALVLEPYALGTLTTTELA